MKGERSTYRDSRSSRTLIGTAVSLAVFTDTYTYGILHQGLIIPILPFALREVADVLEQDIQLWTSILLAAYGAGSIIGALVTGYWADHDGSKRIAFLGGLMILAVSMLAFLIGHSMIIFVVARLVQGASTASVNSIGTAIYADAFTDQGLGLAMGVLDLSMTLGLVSGPVIGGLIYHYYGYRAVFTSAFVLIALDLALRFLVLERAREAYLDPQSNEQEEPGLKDPQDITYLPSANVNETSTLGSSQALYGTMTKDSDSVLDATSSAHRSGNGTADTAPKELSDTQPLSRRSSTIELLLTPRLQMCLLGDFMVNVITTGLESVLPLQLKILFGYNSKEVALVLLMLVIPSFGGPLVGYIAGRYGPRPMISVGFAGLSPLLMLLRVTGQAEFEQVKLVRCLLLMIGVCLNAVLTPVFVEVSHLVEERASKLQDCNVACNKVYAQAYALLAIACACGSLCGPLVGGLKEYVGWTCVTLGAGLICLFCAILSFVVLKKRAN
ncbi:MAG: hypothetical protein LQ337_000135 [Flavoplaca oasis]|nr:MAG: hypothetical protein LQ337_000135 [Flavoplaca oasis]